MGQSTGRFLFTNREGENGHTFLRADLEKLLSQGKMRRADLSESLTDKVFSIMRQSLAVDESCSWILSRYGVVCLMVEFLKRFVVTK